jgi:hypothetical protein
LTLLAVAGAVIFSLDSLAKEDDLEYCTGGATTAGDFCTPINVLTGDAATGVSRGLEEPDLVLNNPRNPPGFFLDSLDSVDACLCLIGGAVT